MRFIQELRRRIRDYRRGYTDEDMERWQTLKSEPTWPGKIIIVTPGELKAAMQDMANNSATPIANPCQVL